MESNTVATLRHTVVNAIRGMIMDGELPPGARLVDHDLCDRLHISRNTLRECYRQLEAEGFIEIKPHRGPVVVTVTDDQARQIYETREAVECFAIRQFTVRASDEQVASLRDVGLKLADAVLEGDGVKVDEWKNRYYDRLFEGAENHVLHDQARLLYSRLARLRARSLSHPGRAEQSAREIRSTLVAIEGRRIDEAEAAWRIHIQHARAAALAEDAS